MSEKLLALADTSEGGEVDRCNLIINYLPQDIDDTGLSILFADMGEVVTAKVVRDKGTKKNLGYGFVKFADESSAQRALHTKNGMIIGSKKLKVSVARPQSEDIKNCKIYVTNLPRAFAESDIRKMFAPFGEIIEIRLLFDQQKKSKGISFVQFSNRIQTEAALTLDGLLLEDSDRPIRVNYAVDKRKANQNNKLRGVGHVLPHPYFYGGNHPTQMMIAQTQAIMSVGHPGGQVYLPSYGEHIKYEQEGIEWVETTAVSRMPGSPGNALVDVASGPASPRRSRFDPGRVSSMGHPHFATERVIYHPHHIPAALSLSQRSERFSGIIILHFASLPTTANIAFLHDLCAPYGRIIGAEIHDEEPEIPSKGNLLISNLCCGRGIVQMDAPECAHMAQQALNGAILFEGATPLAVTMSILRP